MEKSSVDPKQLELLLQTVGKKLGVAPSELKAALESGKLDAASKNMTPDAKKKMQSIMGNPAQMEKLMQSPQAKALYEKLTGKKPK
ncbi:MAG: hypothetical protein IJ496_04230 [Ruminococcus sp.]|nr:hypothetical protein [Ruminococcus sp.]